ncbi:MAG: putative addiction module antidote protein [Candidatus Omnitrophica bacterium]|nr:putative addiction module antidote protein [Candidatus Omnitrophota bacterium]
MKPPIVSYRDRLIRALRAPEEASAYLNAALDEGDKDFFLKALRDVIEAQGGMTKFARAAKLNRVSAYKMLGAKGNPGFENILQILKAAGVRFQVSPATHPKAA